MKGEVRVCWCVRWCVRWCVMMVCAMVCAMVCDDANATFPKRLCSVKMFILDWNTSFMTIFQYMVQTTIIVI